MRRTVTSRSQSISYRKMAACSSASLIHKRLKTTHRSAVSPATAEVGADSSLQTHARSSSAAICRRKASTTNHKQPQSTVRSLMPNLRPVRKIPPNPSLRLIQIKLNQQELVDQAKLQSQHSNKPSWPRSKSRSRCFKPCSRKRKRTQASI